MQLARVTGTLVASTKVPGLEGVKLLIIQPLDRQERPAGKPLVAADAVHMAGPGELVYFVAAREAAQVALAAGVKRLVLTHLSARFSTAWQELLDEARAVFTETTVAKDGMVVEVPFREG